jgi:N-acyl-D-amino-acid deacylase
VKLKFKFLSVLILAAAGRMAGADTDLTTFDRNIATLMAKHHIPGATVAVARHGKLAIARAYGLADREHNIPTQPDSLFRIASISKTFTATAILKLIEEGRLDLDTRVFPLLDQLQPPQGQKADPRLADITVRQLLQHTGGWDRDISGDIAGMIPYAARALNVPSPVGPNDLIRYVVGRPLDFDPGARFAYSNVGYIVLGRVIEKIARMPYEDYIEQAILAPIGVRRMRLGHTLVSQRSDGEVIYYDVPGAPLVWTLVRGGPPVVPAPYAMPLQTFDSCGAWIASTIDLIRFALALDEQSGRELLLKRGTLQQTRGDRVAAWTAPDAERFYGLGWTIDVARDGAETWWHGGGMPGTATLVAHRPDGLVYAVLFNSGPWTVEFGDMASYGDAHEAIAAALNSIEEWPEADLFESYR